MAPSRLWNRARELAVQWTGRIFVLGLFGTAAFAVVLATAVHETAQPEFCNSCHIMEPYYHSWQTSGHKDVGCIECHYEPGAVETLEGKFQALSQLAKYVTRTHGTKPWADVSDASCERSGCHSTRTLEGRIAFGGVTFDHRKHLLESRSGRKLRCTSCHAQNELDQHMSVSESVCFTCHFMPDDQGRIPEETSDCRLCHETPRGEILVDGVAYRHEEYLARGVDCRECHASVVEGTGTVRKERCSSCHTDPRQIARIGEAEFLHDQHVLGRKVECFQCHDEIRHGSLSKPPLASAASEGCGSCHVDSHDAARQLYAGQGAVGLAEAPSRMHRTNVTCDACHTGRSEPAGPDAGPAHGHGGARASTVATAGNVDCIHCHGTGYDGMLAEWQASVGEQLARLRPVLDDLRVRVGSDAGHAAAEPLRDAERNFALVALDGSKGAHNVTYALDALRLAAERLDRVRELLGEPGEERLSAAFPFRSDDGCGSCHSGVGRPAEIARAEHVFPHARHLAAGLDCSACHSVADHGRPAFPRNECASCHHQESETRDVTDCASCHGAQETILRGTVALLDEPKPGGMSEMECGECHGDAPDILRPKPQMCVLCHEDGYDDMQRRWQSETAAGVERVRAAIAKARADGTDPAAVARAEALLASVTDDGSGGAHNFDLTQLLLEQATKALVVE